MSVIIIGIIGLVVSGLSGLVGWLGLRRKNGRDKSQSAKTGSDSTVTQSQAKAGRDAYTAGGNLTVNKSEPMESGQATTGPVLAKPTLRLENLHSVFGIGGQMDNISGGKLEGMFLLAVWSDFLSTGEMRT